MLREATSGQIGDGYPFTVAAGSVDLSGNRLPHRALRRIVRPVCLALYTKDRPNRTTARLEVAADEDCRGRAVARDVGAGRVDYVCEFVLQAKEVLL